jgi:hypothetical protein
LAATTTPATAPRRRSRPDDRFDFLA